MQAGVIILILKVAVIAVTILLTASLVALWRGNYRLHGRINIVFFVLTLSALIGLEVVARIVSPEIFADYFARHDALAESQGRWKPSLFLAIHLSFAMPSAFMLPFMLYTGLKRRRWIHLRLAWVFLVLWTGTFVTGVFFLPHD